MSDPKNRNLKYFIIIGLCFIVLILNAFIFLQPKNKERTTIRKGYFDFTEYYDKEMPPFELKLKNKMVKFPYNKNLLILGINREIKTTFELLDKFFKKIDLKMYDLEVLVLTEKRLSKSKYFKPYTYKNEEFNRFFKIEEGYKFILLVDKDNNIKYYMDKFETMGNIRSLIERFKKL